jgi:hypothetical protein
LFPVFRGLGGGGDDERFFNAGNLPQPWRGGKLGEQRGGQTGYGEERKEGMSHGIDIGEAVANAGNGRRLVLLLNLCFAAGRRRGGA